MKQILVMMAAVVLVGCGDNSTEKPVVPATTESSVVDDPKPVTEAEFEQTKAKAESGDAEEQFNLGVIYAYDSGRGGDFKEAVKWYRKAAEQGNAMAQVNLGVQYANPMYQAVEQDSKEAVKWYRKAAEQGNILGQVYLGSMYDEGKGVEQDLKEALKWYRKAAEQEPQEIVDAEEVLQIFLQEHPELRED